MIIETKGWLKPEFKCTPEVPEGAELTATLKFAKMGEPDHDDDVWQQGSIGTQECLMSQWGHSIWKGTTPIGKVKCREENGFGVADVAFNPEVQAAVETWSTLKFAPELTEVSVGFFVTKYSYGEGMRRYIEEADIYEISPVMRGAGTETGVMSVKSSREVKELQVKDRKSEPELKDEAVTDASEDPSIEGIRALAQFQLLRGGR